MPALTSVQRKVLRGLEDVGATKRSEYLAALMTSIVEANGRNPNYGHLDSVGWRQARSHYGSVAERLKVRRSARGFGREIKGTRGSGMTPGQKAQAVQRSAFPERYDAVRAQAEALLKQWESGAGGSRSKRGGGKGYTVGGRKLTVGAGERVDYSSAIVDSLLAGPEGREGKSLVQDFMERASTGAYTTQDPGTTFTTPKYKIGGGKGGGRGKGAAKGGVTGMEVRKDGWHGAKSVGLAMANLAKKNGLSSVSEKRGTVSTASGGVSDHYHGNKDSYAWDLSNGSSPTKEMDKTARQIAAMLGVKSWKGGVLNVTKIIDGRKYRFQLLYRTNVGGNHYNHVHLGIDRVDTAG